MCREFGKQDSVGGRALVAGLWAVLCLCTHECMSLCNQQWRESSAGASLGSGYTIPPNCKIPFLLVLLDLWDLCSVWDMVEEDVIQVEWQ